MRRIRSVLDCDEDELRRRVRPRDDLLVDEQPSGPGGSSPTHADPASGSGDDVRPSPLPSQGRIAFDTAEGPFTEYRRDVSWSPGTAPDRFRVEQQIAYRLAIPYWSWLYDRVVRRALPDGITAGVTPWWCTPDRLSARGSTMVAAMALLNLVAGLLFGLLTQVLTFASADLGTGSADEQADVFATVRVGIVITMVVMVFADRAGRRRIALWSLAVAGVLTVLAALSPSLWVLTALQLVSRNLAIVGLLCVDTITVEELPRGSRAMVNGLGALAYGLGAGFIVIALPLADLGPWGWRLTFVVAGVTLPMVWHASRYLPESRRFSEVAADRGAAPRQVRGGRFALIAAMFLLFNLFVAPSSQLQNDFLRTELGFSALLITVFTLVTGTPAALGVLAGGRIADVRGRRAALVPGMLALGGFTALFFAASGPALWGAKLAAGVLGTLAVPAMGVIAPELFPTARRGGVRGALSMIAVGGSVVGLLLAGSLVESQGYATTFLLLAVAPALAAMLALAVPETRGRELEDLNP